MDKRENKQGNADKRETADKQAPAGKQTPARYRQTKNGYLLDVKVIPNAGKNELTAAESGFTARLKAPPADGKANEALIALLAAQFDLPKSAVEIVKGKTARHKTILLKTEEPPHQKATAKSGEIVESGETAK